MIDTKTKNQSFITMWRHLQNMQMDNCDFMLRLDHKELLGVNLQEVLFDEGMMETEDGDRIQIKKYYYDLISEEISNNIWYYFREIAFDPSKEAVDMFEKGYYPGEGFYTNFMLTPKRTLLLYLIENGINFTMYIGTGDDSFNKHLLLYSNIKNSIDRVVKLRDPFSPNNTFAKNINLSKYYKYLKDDNLIYTLLLEDEFYDTREPKCYYKSILEYLDDNFLDTMCISHVRDNHKLNIHSLIYTPIDNSSNTNYIEKEANEYNIKYGENSIGHNIFLYDINANDHKALKDIVEKGSKWFKTNNKIVTNIGNMKPYMWNLNESRI